MFLFLLFIFNYIWSINLIVLFNDRYSTRAYDC